MVPNACEDHDGVMTTFELYQPSAAPASSLGAPTMFAEPISEPDRLQAAAKLRAAYIDGRLTAQEYDCRVGAVYNAATRVELDAAFGGVAGPRVQPHLGQVVAPRRMPVAARDPHLVPALVHWSGLFTMPVIPAIAYATATKGSELRREAGRALNTQINFLILFALAAILTTVTGIPHLDDLVGVLWFVITVVGGFKAKNGESWEWGPMRRHGVHPIKES